MQLLWFSFVFLLIVFVHELGHFLVARRFGVGVEKFSVGLGPALLKYRDGKGTNWLLSVLPLGGYVKLRGYELEFDKDSDKKIASLSESEKSDLFCLKPTWQKALVVVAGPGFNYLLAVVCLVLVFLASGVPVPSLKIEQVQRNSIAEGIGLRPGDVISEIDGKALSDIHEFKALLLKTEEFASLGIIREGQMEAISFNWPENTQRVLGIGFAMQMQDKSFLLCFQAALEQTYIISKSIISGIYDVITSGSTADIGGPIKIAELSASAAEQGIVSLLFFIAMLSINLGLINLLPIPMLDGGALFFYIIEMAIGRAVNSRVKYICARIGFIVLVLLTLFAVYADLRNLW